MNIQGGKMRDEVVLWKQQQEKSEKQAGHCKSTPLRALFSSVLPFVNKECFTNFILPECKSLLCFHKNEFHRGVLIQLDDEEQETGS